MIIRIQGEQIELQKLLKFAGAAQTGGQAKELIAVGNVRVNGEREDRRSRKLVAGDVVSVEGFAEMIEISI